jgi:hypothetical protein
MLGNFKNTIYLLSMDDTIVANSLKEVQKYDGYIYLEKIAELQEKKGELFNNLISSDSASAKNLDKSDIEFILGV